MGKISDTMDDLFPLAMGQLAPVGRLPDSATVKPGPHGKPRTPCRARSSRAHRRLLAKYLHRTRRPPKIDPESIRADLKANAEYRAAIAARAEANR